MSERRRGLGRGLGALIPNAPAEEEAEQQPGTGTPPASGGEAGASAGRANVALPDGGGADGSGADEPGNPSAGNVPARAAGTPSGFGTEEAPAHAPATSAAGAAEPVSDDRAPGAQDLENPETDAVDADGPNTDVDGTQAPADARSAPEAARPSGAARNRAAGPAARQKAMKARMDMGEALRGTALGARPSDMFFVPSAPDGAAGEVAGRGDDAGGDGRRSRRPGAGADVSRETKGATGDPATGETGTATGTDAAAEAVPGTAPETTEGVSAPRSTVPEGGGDEGAHGADVSRETSAEEAELAAVPGATFAEVPVDSIHPNRKQPRQVFDEEELAELAYSIGALGVLQPIVVRPSRETGDAEYELVMGERRWRAAQRAGLEAIPAIVRETKDDSLLRDALLENLHRSQLNPLEEAAAYQQLMEEFGATQEELSRRIGRSRPQISNTIRLLRLPPLVQRRVAAGVLSSGHARALLSLTDPAEMERLAQRIVAEGLSVRATEEAVQLAEGTQRTPKRATPSDGRHQERLDYIADAFADRLDTSVKIALGARKGKMTIEFASVEDLNRIIEVLDPGMERS